VRTKSFSVRTKSFSVRTKSTFLNSPVYNFRYEIRALQKALILILFYKKQVGNYEV